MNLLTHLYCILSIVAYQLRSVFVFLTRINDNDNELFFVTFSLNNLGSENNWRHHYITSGFSLQVYKLNCCKSEKRILPLQTWMIMKHACNFDEVIALNLNSTLQRSMQGGPKSKPPPIFQKIVLKIANEIRFLRKVKLWIKHYNTTRW